MLTENLIEMAKPYYHKFVEVVAKCRRCGKPEQPQKTTRKIESKWEKALQKKINWRKELHKEIMS